MRMFDLHRIAEVCREDVEYFKQYGEWHKCPISGYIYQNNNANVLAVAHMDTVFDKDNHYFYAEGKYVNSGKLDNRIGVYILLDILPQIGTFDLLLTDLEESIQSTAAHFKPENDYNWIVEFDRLGHDVVMYSYEDDEMFNLMACYDFPVGRGTFSDIAELEYLGVKGFNFGNGTKGQHTTKCSVDLEVLEEQMVKFDIFYKEMNEVKLPHEIKRGRGYLPISHKYGYIDELTSRYYENEKRYLKDGTGYIYDTERDLWLHESDIDIEEL